MKTTRIVVLSGVVGVLSAITQAAPEVLTTRLADVLVEQGPPTWLPTFGTIGTTLSLYTQGIPTVSSLLMILLVVGFGYYVGHQLDLDDEFRRLSRAIIVGTTVSLIVAWIAVTLYGFDIAFMTAFALRLFATVSLPVIIGVFAGAALAHFRPINYSPPYLNKTNTESASIDRL